MDDQKFKETVCGDLGYIKAKIEMLEERFNNIQPCEKDSVKKSIGLNRRLIFSIYGIMSTLAIALIVNFYK